MTIKSTFLSSKRENKMKRIRTDILNLVQSGRQNIILHGCNCKHTMGAGIARYLSEKFPEIFYTDRTTKFGDSGKLGTFSTTHVRDDLTILNCYTQYDIMQRGGPAPVDYDAIRSCLRKVKEQYWGCLIISPEIGCGLAGGDWGIVEKIFEEELQGEDVLICYI